MYPDNLVFGILNTAARIPDRQLCTKFRSFTLSWSRYGYRGRFIEENSIDLILRRAVELGYRWCLIQAYGHVIAERWSPRASESKPLERVLPDWIHHHDFIVAGHILGNATAGYGLDDEFLLVDLRTFVAAGKPAFERQEDRPIECIKPSARYLAMPQNSSPTVLTPSSELELRVPQTPGWNFIETSLRYGLPVYAFDSEIAANSLNLNTASPEQLALFSSYLDEGIFNYDATRGELAESQQAFLAPVQRNVKNSRHGVFLWNLESYDDVLIPPADFVSPISELYSVAAGFKPNMILESFGFDDETKIVFFDYSEDALNVRRTLCEEWNGEDLPDFIRYLFKKFPFPETFYHLWSGYNPHTVPWNELNDFWELELQKWGGADKLKQHWLRYRGLRHEYIVCNILTEAGRLLKHMRPNPRAVIWWSNAFFTMYSNWFLTVDERQKIYASWVKGLAAQNPDLLLYGSDYNNISVNHIRAGMYPANFTNGSENYLNPVKQSQVEIRF